MRGRAIVGIQKMCLEAEDETQIVEYLKNNSSTSAVYILNKNNEVVSGYGDATYDLNRASNSTINENFKIYPDVSESGDLNEDFEENVVEWAIEAFGKNKFFTFDWSKNNRKKVIYEKSFWVEQPLKNDEKLLIKTNLQFYNEDLWFTSIVSAIIFVISLVPCTFLLFNVLLTFFNQRKIRKVLFFDSITGGNNWFYFEYQAAKLLNSKRNYAMVYLSFVKYDSFSTYHGASEGENLLVGIDKCIKTFFPNKYECFAHYGKADFGLLLKYTNENECVDRVKNILDKLSTNFEHKGLIFQAGIYFVETEKEGNRVVKRKDLDVLDMFNRANTAFSTIADENQNDIAIFDQRLLDDKIWEHKVEEKMEAALQNEEFKVYIQPKYNPVTEEIAGAEALIRWINDEDGFISPGKFIPIFEKNGFIIKIDDYMISHVAQLQANWIAEGKKVVPVSVNVSRVHFADPHLAWHICELVDKYNIPHKLIEIELTESAFFDDKALLLNTVKELKNLGFEISMDDFGAGYSSLNSLKSLPLDILKLDSEFFRGEDFEKRGDIVVSQAIALAKKLNMKVVAEGIEEKDQVDFLLSQDCDMIQGYYYAKPMPAEDYAKKLEEK